MVSPSLSYRSPSQVCAVNPLVAFYDIHEMERCGSFVMSRTPHEAKTYLSYTRKMRIKMKYNKGKYIKSLLLRTQENFFNNVCYYNFIHHFSPETSTAGHRPPPKLLIILLLYFYIT
jgi:hypothetical protein